MYVGTNSCLGSLWYRDEDTDVDTDRHSQKAQKQKDVLGIMHGTSMMKGQVKKKQKDVPECSTTL